MKKILFTLLLFAFTANLIAQEDQVVAVNLPKQIKYNFTTLIDIEASAVKSQGKTGTCWSFSTASFLESEIFREQGEMIDLSEMYIVRHTYPKKAWNYVMRQGNAQFSEGGLAHDVLNAVNNYGLVPESAYSGLLNENKTHNHETLVPELKKVLDAYIKNDKNAKQPNWKKAVDSILNAHLGEIPKTFMYNGLTYTPESFLKMTGINTYNYVTLTSFNHYPYYHSFILNIPDNFSNGSFYNVPLNYLVSITDEALKQGFTLALDCDVSEKTFSSKSGVAVIPNNIENNEKALTYIVKEKSITEEYRQQEFENYNTTDDHLMHIVGLVKDQNGTEYYKVKNSWGNSGERIGNNGYIYMSKPFFKLKTISVMVHKKALPKDVLEKLEI